MPRRLRGILAVAAICLFSPLAFAQSAPPAGDTYATQGDPTQNYGSVPNLSVQATPVSNSYIQFNLATLANGSMPPGVTVTKATLRLYVDAVPEVGSFDVVPSRQLLE